MEKKLVIFGCSKAASLAHFYFKHDSGYQVTAFTVDRSHIQAEEFEGIPLVPFEDIDRLYPPQAFDLFVAIGYKDLNRIREKKYYEAKGKGYTLPSYISSRATHWEDSRIGDNCFILEDNTIQPFVKIGNNVTLWSGNHFGHDASIGDHCFISSHVVVCGGVTIGKNCFVGINSIISNAITVGNENIIGAGAFIQKNTEDKQVFTTKPTPPIKQNSDVFSRFLTCN